MKKIKFFALLSAIALTSTVGFTACSSSDEVADVNPTFDGTSVRTDFAFNVTKASQGATTRMSAASVQETGAFSFRGMDKMFLLPFTGEPALNKTTNVAMFALGALNNTSDITSTKSSKVYSLTIPIGTDNFLFYGTATRDGETNPQIGSVTSSLDGMSTATTGTQNTKDITFSLNQIASSLGDDATKIAAYLTQIANATGWAGTVETAETDGNYRALARLYNAFTKIGGSEARSGSAESVVRTVFDLYKSAKAINDQSSVAGIKTIAEAIMHAIDTPLDGVRVKISGESDPDPANWNAQASGFDPKFPANLGLPLGAAQLAFASNTFSYNTDAIMGNPAVSGQLTVNVANIDYPAELIYFDNSPLRSTDKYKQVRDYPVTTALWDAALGTENGFSSDWTGTSVTSSTRAVAMQNNVNYGVALLETNVCLAEDALEDNMAAIVGGTAVDQTNIDGTQFKVTGLLIGGQPSVVGWDMVRHNDGAFTNVIYDSDITFKNNTLTTAPSINNYTIVFDNYASSGTQKDVLFALQLVNGNQDFYGRDNLIPAGSTFYLVGKLALSGKDFTPVTRKDSYRITHETSADKRVFVQDYKTIANITISKDALKDAYLTIPDLLSTESVFGLSVDLKWEAGLTFNVEL